jgi:hypothetical protein
MHKIWAKALPPVVLALLLLPATALAAGPELSISPDPVSFEKTTAGEESNPVAVEVQNLGDEGVSIEGSAVEGEDNAAFKLGGSDCGWLEAGQHCSVLVTFAPGGVGAKNAVLAVRVKEGPEASAALSGTAVAPQLSYNPASLDFGIQRVNENRSETVQVTNTGEAPVRLGSTGIEGKDSGNFWTSYNDCWSGRRLEVGETCSIQVYFNPWQIDEYEATVTAYAAGVPFSAALRGTGGEALLAPAENPVEFGGAAVGGEGSLRTIILTNEGNFAGAYFIAVIAGGDVGSFQLIDENCTGEPIAPGDSCVARVLFEPVGVGRKVARLAMFGESGGGTMVFLRGEGEPAADDPVQSAAGGDAVSAVAPAAKSKPHRPMRSFRNLGSRRSVRCKRAGVCPRAAIFDARTVAGG